MATIVYDTRLSNHRHDYLDPPEEQDAYHADIVWLIKHLIFDGLIYPNDIALALKLPKKSLAYSIRRTCHQLWSEFLYDHVFIKCANPDCTDSAFYNKHTQKYTDYCCNSCKVKHKVNDPNGPYAANQRAFGKRMQSPEGRKAQSDIMIERMKDFEYRDKSIKLWSQGKKSFYEGIECDSTFEVYFLEHLKKLGYKLPIRPGPVRVKHELYYPDFEFPDHYVEVKSTHTLMRAVEDGQILKIVYTDLYIKPLILVNLTEWYIEDYIAEVKKRGFKLEKID